MKRNKSNRSLAVISDLYFVRDKDHWSPLRGWFVMLPLLEWWRHTMAFGNKGNFLFVKWPEIHHNICHYAHILPEDDKPETTSNIIYFQSIRWRTAGVPVTTQCTHVIPLVHYVFLTNLGYVMNRPNKRTCIHRATDGIPGRGEWGCLRERVCYSHLLRIK